MLDVIEIGDVVLCLLYLRGRPAWKMLTGGLDVEGAIQADLSTDDGDAAILRPVLDSVRMIGDAHRLVPLIEMVDRLTDDVPVTQIFGAMLDRVAMAAGRKGGGEFHTPESITVLAAALLDPGLNDRILDPCCGAGGFVATVVDELLQQGNALDRLTIAISDYSARSRALAYLNLRLRGVTPRVLPGARESLPAGAADHRYDIVMGNPPFNLSDWGGDARLAGQWLYGPPPAHNSNFAWLEYAIASLDQGGQAAVVMPHGAAFSQNTQEQSIRAAMVDDGAVLAVIALPGQMFTATAIPVMLWLLQRSPGQRPDEVLFVDATELGSVRERTRRVLDRAEINRLADTYQEWRSGRRVAVGGLAAGVPIQKIRENGYLLNPRAYIAPMDQVTDLRTQARQVEELTQRLHRLAEDAAQLDRTIDAQLKELP